MNECKKCEDGKGKGEAKGRSCDLRLSRSGKWLAATLCLGHNGPSQYPGQSICIPKLGVIREEGLGEEQVIKRSWLEGLWLLDMLILELSV